MPVSDAPRRRIARLQQAHRREQGEQVGLQHRDLDRARHARALALEQRRHDGAVEVDAGQEVRDGGAGLQRRPVRHAGDAHEARHGLHRQVHRRVVAIGPVAAIAGGGGVDQPRVLRPEQRGAEAEPVHHAGREILHQHVGLGRQAAQQVAPGLRLQVEAERALAGAERGEGQHEAAIGAAPQVLAAGRLDLDHLGAAGRQQEGGIGPVVDLREVEDGDPRQRSRRVHGGARLGHPAASGQGAPGGLTPPRRRP